MKFTFQKSLFSLTTRLFSLLPAAWMLLVLLIFLAIRVLGSHSFESLLPFRKAL
jgi:hypothetical protein